MSFLNIIYFDEFFFNANYNRKIRENNLCSVLVDAHICILLQEEMIGVQKTHARANEKNIIYFVSCNKKKLFCIL